MRVTAILVAAGRGLRLGADRPKQFLELAPNKTMVQLGVDALTSVTAVSEVIVAVPPGLLGAPEAVPQLRPARDDCRIVLVEGGERRQDSMANAFARVPPDADVVLIHDAARPFASRGLMERTIQAAYDHGAAIAALPAVDTIKQARLDGVRRVIAATLPRETIYLAQTPQAFRREVLADAMTAAEGLPVTDEAMLVERAGYPVQLVEGEASNIKVTTAADLVRAQSLISGRDATVMRIGTGYDLHRLVDGRPLILAGVRIPHERGLLGHSDADIVCHAVTDAVLGAAALGDIGRLFPDTDPQWKDADSITLLIAAMERVRAGGYAVSNVDVTVIAERPKLLPYLDAMRANLAGALGIEVSAVSVKGKTNEGVDAMGRGEAMSCHAVALLVPVAAGL